jgi:hypothetical protein
MYPFPPKSTSRLKAGQYWTIALRNGRFAAGVVVALRRNEGSLDRRTFLAGLIDWSGESPVMPKDIEGQVIRERGFAHVKTITENGGEIVDEINPCWGFPEEIPPTDLISTWGYGVIRVYAEKHFGTKSG